MATAQRNTYVTDPKTGGTVFVAKGDDIPKEYKDIITNPKITGEPVEEVRPASLLPSRNSQPGVPHRSASVEDLDALEEDEEGYESMTNDELREELEARGLPTSGSKATLVERLETDDAEGGAGEQG